MQLRLIDVFSWLDGPFLFIADFMVWIWIDGR